MRADRAISMLIALQQRGRLTAAQLATELEVSVRTVLRDVETLSAAGIPVYAVQGAGGGIEVLDGFRTQLTGFLPAEAGAVFLAGQPAVAAVLGVEAPARAARRKVLQALSPDLAGAAAGLDAWFLHEPFEPGTTTPELVAVLARGVRQQVEVRLGPDDRTSVAVRPLGLVLQAGRWLLVHLTGPGAEVTAVADLAPPGVLGRRFDRPEGFDLATFWHTSHPVDPLGRMSPWSSPQVGPTTH